MRNVIYMFVVVLMLGALIGCGTAPQAQVTPTEPPAAEPQVLRLATTTSTADSGLLEAILPDFEARFNAQVEVIAVGTGQALALGESGDVDVVLVHARAREDAFVADGYGINRRDVMYNDFVVVGPAADPAGIAGIATAAEAFTLIAETGSVFAARGDDSGTSTAELGIWRSVGITPTAELNWYRSLGQGMGETLITANEQEAYTLTDRGTFLAMRDSLPDLTILVGGATVAENQDPRLRNPYGVIPVNPDRHEGINATLAEEFAAWLTSPETQAMIGAYGAERFGQPLFYPAAT
ncbi:substrate-binding domain-containing protein [Candidatus Chloroploca sp. Khr17]|uniref:substrate-binding domain-containing protein n=1 Tax=Candidatus Chloroploca sp. Khr17 TaxID=2496869 RepID=UPI00196B7CD8|nr:substrate-binding domain-containing protein [Candidatus Chloroploca sp. Khr17]